MPTQLSSRQPREIWPDALRGFAVLGVFWVNQFAFAWPEEASFNALAWIDSGSPAHRLWQAVIVLGNYKFLPILSVLFGFSLALQLERFPNRRCIVRRLIILAAIGALHAYLIWYGDILLLYSAAGMMMLWLSRFPNRTLLLSAVMLYLVPALMNIATYIIVQQADSPQLQDSLLRLWQPREATLAREANAYLGSWPEQFGERVNTAWRRHSEDYLQGSLWQTLSLMCVGMVIGRTSASRRAQPLSGELKQVAALGLMVTGGLWINDLSARQFDDPAYYLLLEPIWHDWLSLLLSGAYSALVINALPVLWRPLRTGLVACGRVALSLYLLQSLLATGLYYGLGLFGHPPAALLIMLPLSFTGVALFLAPIWLRWFGTGPAEWLWRQLSDR